MRRSTVILAGLVFMANTRSLVSVCVFTSNGALPTATIGAL